MRIATTTFSKYGHAEFDIEFLNALARPDIESFIRGLECTVRDGDVYKDGDLVQLGCMLLMVRSIDGRLNVLEPDMVTFPIVWTPGVSRSLEILGSQRSIAELVGLAKQMDFSSIRHSLVQGIDVDSSVSEFVMERCGPNDSDSGWFFGRLDTKLSYNNPSHLCRVSLYEAILLCPSITKYLALPSGCRVEHWAHRSNIYRYGKQLGGASSAAEGNAGVSRSRAELGHPASRRDGPVT